MRLENYMISKLIPKISTGMFVSNIKTEYFVGREIPIFNVSNLTKYALNNT